MLEKISKMINSFLDWVYKNHIFLIGYPLFIFIAIFLIGFFFGALGLLLKILVAVISFALSFAIIVVFGAIVFLYLFKFVVSVYSKLFR